MAKIDLIQSIDPDSGDVTIAFPIDNKVQTLGGLPVNDASELEEALIKYEEAYEFGLSEVRIQIDKSLQSKVQSKVN